MNFIQKIFAQAKERQSGYILALKELKNNVGTKSYFKFDTESRFITLKKNHLEWYWKSDPEKHIHKEFYGDLRETYWKRNIGIKYSSSSRRLHLVIEFGRYSSIEIYKKKNECKEFLEEFGKRYSDYLFRFVRLCSKKEKEFKRENKK